MEDKKLENLDARIIALTGVVAAIVRALDATNPGTGELMKKALLTSSAKQRDKDPALAAEFDKLADRLGTFGDG